MKEHLNPFMAMITPEHTGRWLFELPYPQKPQARGPPKTGISSLMVTLIHTFPQYLVTKAHRVTIHGNHLFQTNPTNGLTKTTICVIRTTVLFKTLKSV